MAEKKPSHKTEGIKVHFSDPTPAVAVQFERGPNFCSSYANNVRFESTVYDLKLIFGQSEQRDGKEVIVQHTAITMPWAAIKGGLYYLELNVLLHELYNGKISIPPGQIPAPFPEPSAEVRAADPRAQEVYESGNRIRESFLAKT